jgi:hypothetical protein
MENQPDFFEDRLLNTDHDGQWTALAPSSPAREQIDLEKVKQR